MLGFVQGLRRNRAKQIQRRDSSFKSRSPDEAQRNPGSLRERVKVIRRLVRLLIRKRQRTPDYGYASSGLRWSTAQENLAEVVGALVEAAQSSILP